MPPGADLRSIRDGVAFVGRMSDNLVQLGPFSLGIDGVLSWIPGLGELYSTLAGGYILIQGARAGVPLLTLAGAGALLLARTLVSVAPFAGAVAADVFTAHKWAAGMIVRDIDRRLMGAQDVAPSYWGGSRPMAPI